MIIPYGKQDVNQVDIDAVIKVLESDFLTQGPQVPLFEKNIMDYCNVNYAVATNSATSALHLACKSLGLGDGDWLWTSPNTFVASANCARYCGAQVDFIDIDLQTYNLCADALERKLITAKKENKLPKIVMPVHFAGQSCDMKRIHELSQQYKFKIVEDAAHAIGGKYDNNPIGCCQYADITVFSFHPVKIITTAEGGIATTNDEKLAATMKLLRSHGVTRDPRRMENIPDGGWYYEQIELGYNYRMTDVQAALGSSQMQRLEKFIEIRHQIKKRYDVALKALPVFLPYQAKECVSSMHLYPILLDLERLNKTHAQVFSELREKELSVNLHYIPVYKHPYFRRLGVKQTTCPNVEEYYKRAISIPMYSGLTETQQERVVSELSAVLQ